MSISWPGPLHEVLKREPVFAVTADMDWASEFCIETLLATCDDFAIRPTLFVTHESSVIASAARSGRAELGIHPNFLLHSSHGDEPREIVDHVLRIAPGSRGSRGHCFASNTHIIRALRDAGVHYDSGPVAFLQPDLMPLRNQSGLLHLPVFWEDDVHWGVMSEWDLRSLQREFLRPGLKIVNVHPFFFTLNVPNAAFYQDHKPHIPTLTREQTEAMRFRGVGCADFVRDLFSLVARHADHLYSMDAIEDWARASPQWGEPAWSVGNDGPAAQLFTAASDPTEPRSS